MSIRRTIIRNVISNWAGYAVNVIVALILSPIVVHTLGDKLYGLWALIMSMTGYYGLLDLGVRSAVGQYVTRYWAVGDIAGVNRTMNTAAVVLSIVAVMAVAVSGLVAAFLPGWFSLQGTDARNAAMAMLVMGTGIGLGLPLAIYGSATLARQRYDISNAIGITTRLLSAGLAYWALISGYGILGLAVADVGCKLLDWSARVVLAYRLLPGLKFAPRLLRRDSLRELGSYGALSFINRMGNQITSYVQALVIGIFMPVEAVTYYVIGANLMPYFENIIGTITLTFTPEATACDARGDRAGLRRLWLLGTRGTTLFVCLIGGGMIFLGRDFLRLWMGDKYLLGYPFASSAAVLTLLTVGALVRNSQTCGLQILFGMRRVRFLAINSSIEAVATLVLSVVLVQRFGLIGVAVASIVPVLVTRGFLMPQYLLRQIHVGVGDYLRQAFQGGVGILLTMGLCSLVLSERMPVANWSQFFLKAAAIAGPAGIVGLLLETLVRRDSLLRLRSRPAAVDQDENVDRTI